MSIKNNTPLKILEKKVTSFLQLYAKNTYSKYKIAPYISKQSLEPNHLYEDLGFKNRIQMGKFMKKHFPNLEKEKPKEKLWKKFIYDSIGEIAPACENCTTQNNCFICKV